MKLSSEHVEEIVLLTIPEETLTADNVKGFKEDMEQFLLPGARILLNLQQVRFVDSSGIGSIVSIMKKIEASGGELKLCCVSTTVHALFELIKINLLIDVCKTREDAMEAFHKPSGGDAQ